MAEETDWMEAANGEVPSGALVGGNDKEGNLMYIARSHGTLGRLLPSDKCALLGYFSSNPNMPAPPTAAYQYQVLVGDEADFKWVPKENISGSSNVIRGGKSENGKTLIVARVITEGAVVPGFTTESFETCIAVTKIPNSNTTAVQSFTDFEVLVK